MNKPLKEYDYIRRLLGELWNNCKQFCNANHQRQRIKSRGHVFHDKEIFHLQRKCQSEATYTVYFYHLYFLPTKIKRRLGKEELHRR